MTTSSDPSIELERAWAAGQLGVGADNAAAARTALARQLCGHDFLPPPDWQALARVTLEGCPPANLTAAEGLLTGRRDVLRQQVEEFCAEFFQFEPAERRERHAGLVSACVAHAPLLARLEALTSGLDVAVASGGDSQPAVDTLSGVVKRLFTSRPYDRAVARDAFLRSARERPGEWAAAARSLANLQPSLARLDESLLWRLVGWKAERRALAAATRAQKRTNRPTIQTQLYRWRSLISWAVGIGSVVGLLLAASMSNLDHDTRVRRARKSHNAHRRYEYPSQGTRLSTTPIVPPIPPFVQELPLTIPPRTTKKESLVKRPSRKSRTPLPIVKPSPIFETNIDKNGFLQPRPDWASRLPSSAANRPGQLVLPNRVQVPDPVGRRSFRPLTTP